MSRTKEIVVNTGRQTRIAIVERGELAELYIENQEHERTIGNIFLGRVRKIMPSIQACFVDIGQKQDAFLHFSDLVDNLPDWIDFVEADQAKVGTFKTNYEHRPAKRRRRHPKHGSGKKSGKKGSSRKDVNKRKSAQQRQKGSRKKGGSGGGRNRGKGSVNPISCLKRDLPILVKVSKEPIANKGSRITTDISLAGRFLVLVPFADYVAVSKKIMSYKERRRLKALAKSLLPEGFGVIVRTVAEGRNAKALDTDLNLLIERWRGIERELHKNQKPPAVIYEDVNMVSSIMRDLFTEEYDRILIDDQRLYRNIRGYVQAIAPQMAQKVKLHNGNEAVFQAAGIQKEVEEAFSSKVNLPSGGYLFIEQTEAMHVIDVNSGRAGRGLSQEENSCRVNLEAAKVLSKQVRLRDLGGIIVVDFIDMRNEKNRRKVYDALRKEFRRDRAVTKVLPMSDFGLMQITRQRLRPSITKTFSLPGSEPGTEPGTEPGREPGADKDNVVKQNGQRDKSSGDGQKTSRNGGGADRKGDQRAVEEKKDTSRQTSGRSGGEGHQPGYRTVGPEELIDKIDDWLTRYREQEDRKGAVRLVVHPFTAAYFNKRIPNQATRWFMKHLVRIRVDTKADMDPLSFRVYDVKSGDELTRSGRRGGRGKGRGRGRGNRSNRSREQSQAN